VLVVDDHALFAEALMLTLGIDERIEVVGSASSGVEGVSLAEALRPDVVLLDAPDWRYLAYHLGGDLVTRLVVGGELR